jgi:hypothetical protein
MNLARRSRRRTVLVGFAAFTLVGAILQAQAAHPTPALAATTQVDSGVIGWDGDKDAAIAHRDGSFDIRAGKNITVGFGIYNNPSKLQWTNAGGYYPALTTRFERDNTTVTITNFGDRVTVGGNAYVAVYSRVAVFNHDSAAHTESPAASSQLLALNSASTTVQPGQTVNHDYVIAVDKFGASYGWPADSALVAAGGYDARYQDMTTYWDNKLAGIAQLSVPDPRLVNAFKAGYVYTQIVKDGNNLDVGENGYDQLFDHDLIGILVSLMEEGDLSNAQAYLQTLFSNQYPDAIYKHSWPWAVYLEKTGDTAYVSANFASIQSWAHQIVTDATGPGGTMMKSNAIDTNGYWTVDDQSALLGLLAYKYIAQRLGNSSEASWASSHYDTLFAAVNNRLQSTINANGLTYLPCAVDVPNTADRCSNTNDANWASALLFGRWNWDGLLFGAAQTGPMATLLDSTYNYGFAHLSGLPAHTYGGYPGYSTAYNAGYGEAGLASSGHRSEGVYDYQFMINNTQSAPYSWWEGIPSAGATNWSPGTHATSGTGSSPHMWGQANASKVLLNSLIAEQSNGQVIVGRGIPNEWLRNGQTISATNYPIANGNRMGATMNTSGNNVTLTLSGAAPAGGVAFEIPYFAGHIASAGAGTVDNANGVVTLGPATRSVTVTLTSPPSFTTLGGLDLTSYCTSIGDIGGASLDGSTANDWKCITDSGTHVALSMDDACAWGYLTNEGAFSQMGSVSDPYSWKCYAS